MAKYLICFLLFFSFSSVHASGDRPMYRFNIYQNKFIEVTKCPKTHFIFEANNENHCLIDLYKNQKDSTFQTKNNQISLREKYSPNSKIIIKIPAGSFFQVWDKRGSKYIGRYFDNQGNIYTGWLNISDLVKIGKLYYTVPNNIGDKITYLAESCPQGYEENANSCRVNTDFLSDIYKSSYDKKTRTIVLNTDEIILYSQPNWQSQVKYSGFANDDAKNFLYSDNNWLYSGDFSVNPNASSGKPFVQILSHSQEKDWYWVFYGYGYKEEEWKYGWIHKSLFLTIQ